MFTLTGGLSTVTVNVLTLSVASATISVNAITMGGLLANIIYYRFPRSIAFANTRLKHQNGCHIWNNFLDVYTNRSTCSYIKFHQGSAVGNVSGYKCVSDCRSRGREFDPGPVPYFRGEIKVRNNFYGHSPPSADLFKRGCCQLQAKVCAQITG